MFRNTAEQTSHVRQPNCSFISYLLKDEADAVADTIRYLLTEVGKCQDSKQ